MRMERRLHRPSIEASLARKQQNAEAHPFAKRFSDLPVLGSVVRAWVRATHSDEPTRRWASLPPFATA